MASADLDPGSATSVMMVTPGAAGSGFGGRCARGSAGAEDPVGALGDRSPPAARELGLRPGRKGRSDSQRPEQ